MFKKLAMIAAGLMPILFILREFECLDRNGHSEEHPACVF